MPSVTHALDRALANEQDVLADWIQLQLNATTLRPDLMKESELRTQSREFISLLRQAIATGKEFSLTAPEWVSTSDFLAGVSRSRAVQGFSPAETATFVLSLKQPLFAHLRKQFENSAGELADAMWRTTEILDKVISRQQQELLELSTPVVDLWTGILALPLIGTLDSARTQVVMESLLEAIVRTGASIAIIDITGVPTVDTLVAQHLLKTVAAARLMGADCIISGIRPQIAQTIVHLGVDLSEVSTKATLADAFTLALRKTNASVGKSS
jgi:rsbT co-antagonist protein RsbR